MSAATRPALKYVTVSARCSEHGDLAAAMSTPPVTTKCPKCAARCAVKRTGHAMRAHDWTFVADDKADATKRAAMKAAHAKRTVSRRGHDGQPPVPEKDPGRPQCAACGQEDVVARGLGRKCYARARAAGTLPPKFGEQPKDMRPAQPATTTDRPSTAAPTTSAAPAPHHPPSTEPRSDAPRPAQTSAPRIEADGYVVVDVRLGLDEMAALAAQGTFVVAMGHLTELMRLVAAAR